MRVRHQQEGQSIVTTKAPHQSWGFWVFMACAGIVLTCSLARSQSVGKEESPKGLMASTFEQGTANRRGSEGKPSDVFPNILLRTQDDTPVRFYDDLVKGKTVLVNFIYTSCRTSCSPTTANLARVHKLLGDRVGRDLFLLSISLDPVVDQPKKLKEYAARFGQFRGWYFLTGNEAEIDDLRRKMGAYDLDPVIDADKTQHAGIVIVGNETTNRWSSLPTLMDYRQIAQTVLRITRNRG
ncbi:MAG: SCO family protein [Nitrospira sp.]|nr:MAG: SCO family protein [Nitrospira sp.]